MSILFCFVFNVHERIVQVFKYAAVQTLICQKA